MLSWTKHLHELFVEGKRSLNVWNSSYALIMDGHGWSHCWVKGYFHIHKLAWIFAVTLTYNFVMNSGGCQTWMITRFWNSCDFTNDIFLIDFLCLLLMSYSRFFMCGVVQCAIVTISLDGVWDDNVANIVITVKLKKILIWRLECCEN